MTLYNELLKRIGKNIRAERTYKGWSQEKFAEIANVHTNYIGKIERGEQNLTIKKLTDILDILNMPIENAIRK